MLRALRLYYTVRRKAFPLRGVIWAITCGWRFVRNAEDDATSSSGNSRVEGGGGTPLRFGAPAVGLPHRVNVANVAFSCVHERMLVAYGGMAHTADQDDWQGNDVGIVRSVADADAWPLRWSSPQLTITGDERSTGCIDENAEPTLCEYDGKLSVVHFGGKVFVRALQLIAFGRRKARTGGEVKRWHKQMVQVRTGLDKWLSIWPGSRDE